MTDWFEGEVPANLAILDQKQVSRLMRMTAAFREDWSTMMVAAHIKEAFWKEDTMLAQQLWMELEQEEQQTLWIAPTYGGIFTTQERKLLREAE